MELGITIILIWLLIAAGIVSGIVYGIIKCVKRANKHPRIRLRYLFPVIICVIIAFISWIFNLGWFRVILTWFPIPLIYSIFYILANIRAARFISLNGINNKLRTLMTSSHITYLLSFLLFPDFGDVGPAYVFFGLIRHKIASLFTAVSIPLFIATTVIIIVMLCNTKLFEKSQKDSRISENCENNDNIN